MASDDSKEPQMDTRIPPRLYGLNQVCDATGLGKTTVKNLIYEGELDSIRVGRRRLVPVESIDKFIRTRLERQLKCSSIPAPSAGRKVHYWVPEEEE